MEPDPIRFAGPVGGLYLLRQLEVDEEELARCRAVWKQPEPRYGRGVLAKFSALARPPTKAR